MKRKALTVATAALMAAGVAGAASAETAMRCSHQLPPAHTVAQVIDRWAAEVETLSGGEIDVQVFGADSLVGAKENIVATAKGDIECAFSVQFQWGKTLPIMTVTTAPYAFSDLNIWRNWDGSEAANFLEDKLRGKGVENVVWLFQTNSSVFTSNGKFLAAPADFAGMKVRGLAPAFDAGLGALGAAPTAIPGSEVYQALATGVLDGAMTGSDAAVSRKYYEVQDHFVVSPVISVYFHGYVNPKFYAGLSDTAKAALDEAGAKAAVWAVEAAEAGIASAPGDLEAKGAQVHIATDAENAAMEAAMRPAFDAAFQSDDPDSVKLLGLIDALRSGS
ncbi:TRAP transporter substrate-binding protein DctP [Pseudoprimorskyibacter insulae]|uniref:Solute-binding protein n=1 Tax=Pseudoprimorskyibacter insulae TaxID=1695997 RepID=A0A2R8B0D3_9RHOB|nr:TRAP transporter substrate-binding protein DctP [Pseudoprimorskyibacter insulae]SPF81738.1 Solute-binding protein [Pseudoprimorskyibacter insulae]